ncbi:MAG: sporulation protein YqfD [Clostridiales bacterium]|jgi:similar to stage IV sporulation protein|nr:sporulation protein YqfD [Clostridiales bacterium]
MFLALWNYIRGYVIIRVTGFSVERFINLAARRGIYLWDITKNEDGVYMKVSVKGFKMLRPCARKTKSRVKIKAKIGLPIYANRYRKRKIFAAGFIFFVFALYYLSSFVWLVEAQGNSKIKTKDIITFLSEQNIRVGGQKRFINKKDAEKKFLSEFTDASWVNITIKGTRATVYLTEIIPKQVIIDRNTPCDVKAAKNGIITSIATSAGTPLKKENDTVLKGETIVSGKLVIGDDDTGRQIKYTHANAEVFAKTYYNMEFYTPYNYVKKVLTNKVSKVRYVTFLGKKFKLNPFKSSIPYITYDKITTMNQLKVTDSYPLPVIITTEEYREYKKELGRYTPEEAKEVSRRAVNRQIINEFDFAADITGTQISYEEMPGGLKVSALITALERIDIQSAVTE